MNFEKYNRTGRTGWKCEQTGPQHSAATGLQRSRIEQAGVQDMIGANRLLQQLKKESGQAIRIFSFLSEERLALIGWGDAALQNRIDGGSTKGLLFTCSSVRPLQGEESLMSVISWRCGQIDSVCRGAMCAETRSIVWIWKMNCLRFDINGLRMSGNSEMYNSPDEMARWGTWCNV